MKTKHFILMTLMVGWNAFHAQEVNSLGGAPSQPWQPDFNDDRLLSMPDLLPLLGYFGAQWDGPLAREGQASSAPKFFELDWTGREDESLILPANADFIILNPGLNDLTQEEQNSVTIRHIRVESWIANGSEYGHSAVDIHQALPWKQQVLLLNRGEDLHGNPMRFGARYILHFPDGSVGEVSTNSLGSMSVSGKPLRTMAYLLHAGGKVYFGQ